MRAFRRLLLLTLFAAAGVALAFGVALSSRPPDSCLAETGSNSTDRDTRAEPEPRGSASSAAPTTPSGEHSTERIRRRDLDDWIAGLSERPR